MLALKTDSRDLLVDSLSIGEGGVQSLLNAFVLVSFGKGVGTDKLKL